MLCIDSKNKNNVGQHACYRFNDECDKILIITNDNESINGLLHFFRFTKQ